MRNDPEAFAALCEGYELNGEARARGDIGSPPPPRSYSSIYRIIRDYDVRMPGTIGLKIIHWIEKALLGDVWVPMPRRYLQLPEALELWRERSASIPLPTYIPISRVVISGDHTSARHNEYFVTFNGFQELAAAIEENAEALAELRSGYELRRAAAAEGKLVLPLPAYPKVVEVIEARTPGIFGVLTKVCIIEHLEHLLEDRIA